MPPKKVAVLKDEFIPSPIKELLQLFDLIDSLYIFLNRRHMPCTLKSMKALIKTMNISEPISLDLNNIFILTQIHGDGMLLAINLSSDPSLLSTQETISELVEVTFTEISGVSPTQQAKRRQSFRKSLSHYIYAQVADCFEDFLVKSQESSPKKKSSKKNDPVKEAWETVCESNIWPNNINTSSFKLPQAQLDYHPTLRECPVLVNYIAKEASLRSVATTLQSTHINLSTNDPSLDSCITEEHISVNPTSSEIINNRDDLLKQHEGKINRAIHTLLNSPIYKGQIVHMKITDAQPAVYANLHRPLTSANLQMTLEQVLGIKKFYRHQAAAIDAVRSGKHVVLSTSTASGKSLVFNVPVIESILERPETRALYLFPTKALAQDQLRALNQIILNPSFPLSVTSGICDGDVGFADRVKIRESCQMVISNPDMLHYTLLPQHITWKHFFANLRYVVIDEAHEYKGAFGAHVSCVLRRLLRVCLHYGSVPLFVVCSATIGNPLQHFMNLAPLKALYSTSTGDSDDVDKWKDRVCVVDQSQDGSPCGQQTFVIWNPPVKRLSSLAVLTSEKALVSSGKIAEVKIPTDDNMSIENTENDTCNGDNSTNKAVDTSGQQTVDISVGFEEVVSYGYEYDYGGAESGHDQHPFPTFLRGCEDRPTTFGMPVNPHTHVRYTGGWGRKRKLKPIKDEQGEEEVPPEKEVDRKVIHPVGHKKVNNKYKQRNQLNVQSNDQEYVDTMERYSSIIEASLIFSRLIESHCRTLVFCKSRKLVELVLKYSLQEVRRLDDSGQLAQRVASYRGGYTKEERRAIEKDLFSGHLLGVTATCALELGVDVGSLDCTLHLGYPGSASSLRQQAGRAGRSGQDSTSILICFDSAIDQFYASHPRILCDIPSESVILSENTHVLRAHLLAAARELPLNLSWNLPSKQHDASPTMTSNVPVTDSLDCFVSEEGLMSSDIDPVELGRRIWEQNQKKLYITSSHTTISSATISDRSSSNSTNGDNDSHGLVSDSELWGNLYTEVVTYLCNAGNLQARPTCHQSHQKSVISHTNILENNSFHPTGSTNETSFSLRLIDPVSISIVDISQSVEREIDSLGYSRAFFELFEGAIYMHRAEQYRIVKLDLRIHKASCIPVRVDYYTASCNSTNIVITKVHREQSLVKSGHCTVSTDVYGYYKIRLRTGEKFDKGECSLPPLVFDTQATWIDLPLPIKAALESENINPEAAIHSLSHVLLTLAHILTQCDVSDLETEHIALFGTVSNKTQSLRILFYDKRPGGLGLANHLFTHLPKMLESARELLEECPCSGGCPSCILSSTCGGYNQCINKNGALILATLLCSAIADPVYKSDQDTINNVSTVPGPTASIPFHLMSPNTKIKTRKLFSSSRADYMDFGELQQLKVQNPWSESCGYFYSDYDLLQR